MAVETFDGGKEFGCRMQHDPEAYRRLRQAEKAADLAVQEGVHAGRILRHHQEGLAEAKAKVEAIGSLVAVASEAVKERRKAYLATLRSARKKKGAKGGT